MTSGKGKISLEAIMHFVLHNSFLFTVAVMGFVHMGLLAIMLWAGVTQLAIVNIVSVAVYLICVLLCRFERIMPVYISILLEVTIYAFIAVYYVGWRSGAVCFLCSIVPIIIYFGCYLFKGAKRWIIVLLLVFNFSAYVFLYLRFAYVNPVYDLPDIIRKVLVIYSSFVMVFSTIFYSVIYIYASEYEMVSLERKNEQLSVDARVDVLTELLNRRGFLPMVGSLMNEEKPDHFCIAFFDIDDFKHINDSYGHDAGDEVLRHISSIIKRDMQGCDVCRWGGEEFVILLRDYDMDVAKQKMEFIRKSIETTPTVFFNKRISATITIGLVEFRNRFHEPEEIIKVADERMYYGKQHGKNIVISEEHDVQSNPA